jgi:hypothetical protein
MAVKDRTPTLAIVVDVKEAFMHCAKALRRARIWQTDAMLDRREMPSHVAMVREQVFGKPVNPEDLPAIELDLEKDLENTMY